MKTTDENQKLPLITRNSINGFKNETQNKLKYKLPLLKSNVKGISNSNTPVVPTRHGRMFI